MSSARVIDGKSFAAAMIARIAGEAAALPVRPGLAVILVGDDPASGIYVRNKIRAAARANIASFEHRFGAEVSEAEILQLIQRLNVDPLVHGVLVQLPLPPQIDARKILTAIDPAKDVDGFHVTNAGRLAVGMNALVPCTPQGCLMLLKQELGSLRGLHAVVVGCSNIVGRPMAQLLLQEECTVTITHIHTRDVAAETRRADIVVVAVGKAGLVRADWIKPGAVVIDVGINRIEVEGEARIVGDVAFDEAREVAGAITPVPGGVGPMTIACLMQNTLLAAQVFSIK
jgi:methylenetetrahydrofolate dehydrogenase (NADP+) / methenyltetrahydrofolate cyclohydrolase